MNTILKVQNKWKFQIPKTILSPTVLLVNTKNKMKTEFILDSHR